MQTNTLIRCVIYARYSSDGRLEESIEGQLREYKEYAERQGMTVITTYVNRATSAKTDNRPEFQKMIEDSAKKQFDVVLVWKLDRFARNRGDSAMYHAVPKRNGVKVVSAKENISEGPEGIILESLLEGIAEYYSAELSVKIQRGQTENALKCKANSTSPLGYKVNAERYYEIDPLTAPIVLEIFTRYADRETVKEIGEDMNTRGIFATMKSKYMNKSSMHNLLKNRRYIGEYRYGKHVTPNVMMTGTSGTSKTGKIHNYYKCNNAIYKKSCDKKTVKKDLIERFVVVLTRDFVLRDEVNW